MKNTLTRIAVVLALVWVISAIAFAAPAKADSEYQDAVCRLGAATVMSAADYYAVTRDPVGMMNVLAMNATFEEGDRARAANGIIILLAPEDAPVDDIVSQLFNTFYHGCMGTGEGT